MLRCAALQPQWVTGKLDEIQQLLLMLSGQIAVAMVYCLKATCVAHFVKHPTSAQVMIARSVGSSPASGSVLTARSLEPASDSVSPSLSTPSPACALSLSVSKINVKKMCFFFLTFIYF